MQNQIFTGPNFDLKWQQIKTAGLTDLRVVSDFDRTLTQAFMAGKPTYTSFSILQQPGILSEKFRLYTQELFRTYRPIELANDLDEEYKNQKMEEWWTYTLQAIIDEKLHQDTILQVVQHEGFIWRAGATDFLKQIQQLELPFSVFSSGMGDVIKTFFKLQEIFPTQVEVIANYLEFNEAGYAYNFLTPVLHAANKNETTLKARQISENYTDRSHVLLFGDQIGDAQMSQDLPDNCVLRIGFLNEEIETNLSKFQQTYDAVVIGDGSFDFVNNLIDEIN
jgi:5'-nucleotidase